MKNFKLTNYVWNETIENDCYIFRPEIEDEDLAQENSDCTDFGDKDFEIASLEYGDKRYCIETTCDRWNLYLWEETCENGCWETIGCTNITGDQEDWKDIIDVNNYLLDLFGLVDFRIERR